MVMCYFNIIIYMIDSSPFPAPLPSYPTALEMVASGLVDVKPLITHTYQLEQSLDAFSRAKSGEGGAIKVTD